ncbi:MAG: hypothetical protein GY754_41200 [bacterium]|nr:hypothetical protein [bacterium]
MKRNLFSIILGMALVSVLAFSGCEDSGFSGDVGSNEYTDLENRINGLQAIINEQAETIEKYDRILEGVSRLTDPHTGQPTIRFTGVNVQIVNGLGYTNGIDNSGATVGVVNGLGNLIVGYNGERTGSWASAYNDRSGSHNIIVGNENNYSFYGGLVVGAWNTISGQYSSVVGGNLNTASGDYSSVSGGYSNEAVGHRSSVSGGMGVSTAGGYDWAAGSTFYHEHK